MIQIRQTEDDLPGNRFPHSLRHIGGLLSRRYAQHSMRNASATRTEFGGWTSATAIVRSPRAVFRKALTGRHSLPLWLTAPLRLPPDDYCPRNYPNSARPRLFCVPHPPIWVHTMFTSVQISRDRPSSVWHSPKYYRIRPAASSHRPPLGCLPCASHSSMPPTFI